MQQLRPPARARAGFTLLELLVASAIGAFITLAAVAFASQQTRLLGLTSEVLDVSQSGRFAIDRLAADLRVAGAGTGYDEGGRFTGLDLGSFTRGGATFESNNRAIILEGGAATTDDLGLLIANGGYATIAAFNQAGSGQLCSGSGFEDGDVVLLRSEDGISARTVRITSIGASGCSEGVCRDGCESFTWEADPSFTSGPDATSVSYAGGEAAGDFQRVAWFVDAADPSRPNFGRLRRAEGDCAAADHGCGELIADGVESLQLRVFEWSEGGWIDRTGTTGRIDSRGRLRVDVELVLRSRQTEPERVHPPILSVLEPGLCLPECGSKDGVSRRVISTSVELKSSGRVQFRRER